jgi:CRISPR system Cascade subunit CasB
MNADRRACDHAFVAFLDSLVRNNDRATLAALRRARGRSPTAIEAYQYVMPRVAEDTDGFEREREEEIYLLVAGLFAFHQLPWPADYSQKGYTNFGASMARLASATESAGVERRMTALLACSFDDLPEHLRHAVSLLKSKQIPVDWMRLIGDLRRWNSEDRTVQREWARAFWAGARESGETAHAQETGEETNDH